MAALKQPTDQGQAPDPRKPTTPADCNIAGHLFRENPRIPVRRNAKRRRSVSVGIKVGQNLRVQGAQRLFQPRAAKLKRLMQTLDKNRKHRRQKRHKAGKGQQSQ